MTRRKAQISTLLLAMLMVNAAVLASAQDTASHTLLGHWRVAGHRAPHMEPAPEGWLGRILIAGEKHMQFGEAQCAADYHARPVLAQAYALDYFHTTPAALGMPDGVITHIATGCTIAGLESILLIAPDAALFEYNAMFFYLRRQPAPPAVALAPATPPLPEAATTPAKPRADKKNPLPQQRSDIKTGRLNRSHAACRTLRVSGMEWADYQILPEHSFSLTLPEYGSVCFLTLAHDRQGDRFVLANRQGKPLARFADDASAYTQAVSFPDLNQDSIPEVVAIMRDSAGQPQNRAYWSHTALQQAQDTAARGPTWRTDAVVNQQLNQFTSFKSVKRYLSNPTNQPNS